MRKLLILLTLLSFSCNHLEKKESDVWEAPVKNTEKVVVIYSTDWCHWCDVAKKFMEKNNCVIALGGGAFINKTIRENILKNAISIWLDVDIKSLNKRIKWNQKRPLLKNENNQKKLYELYAERKNIYKLANHKITCRGLSKKNIAEKIISLYEKY